MPQLYTSNKPTGEIPQFDLLSFLFDSPLTLATDTTVLHADAAKPNEGITKAEARVLTRRIAHTLRTRFGIGQHGSGKDIVVVVSTGQFLLPILFYGILAAGGVASMASSSFKPEELARQIQQGSPKLCISCPTAQDTLLTAARLCDFPSHRCLVLDSSQPQGLLRILTGTSPQSIIGHSELEWERITNKEELENSLICLLYSSGTTGPPKGVRISHTNMVAAAYLEGEGLREHWETTKTTWAYRTLAHLPSAHIAGVKRYFIIPFYMGGVTFWMPKFDFVQFLEFNRSLEITIFLSVPPIYLLCVKSPIVKDHFRSLKSALSKPAPLGKDLQIEVSKKLGVFLGQTWGLSETTGSVSGGEVNVEDLSGSVGPLLPHMTIRIIDDDGNDCPPETPGEILVKSPVVTRGYYNNPEANAESFKDGFFCTGDIGFIREGRVFVVDRKKELIKYKGLQVAPAELEALLISHPHILDAGVIGVFDEQQSTEVPRAYVVADKSVISAQAIQDFVKNRLASHKQLRGGVEFVAAIPKSRTGKILRKDLRIMAMASGPTKAKL
ncbi:4-coumarate-CoA ligase [Mycena galopus ATCC 62051]|nr:4-coumarate-CoA ligase [Mycena galopus ATCC 62051]